MPKKVKSSRTTDGYYRREFANEQARRKAFSLSKEDAEKVASDLPKEVAEQILKNYSDK